MIALLLYTDAGGKWRATVADVLERGSALDYLRTVMPADLMGDPTTELLERAGQETAAWADLADLITVFDPRYPSQLADVHDLPPFLFTRGDLDGGGADRRGVCLVGSRAASRAALDFSYQLASALAGEQVAVISGLAAGIDTAAHRGALDNSGRTVAVIGTGIDRFYPPQNRALQSEIEQHGLVLSQFWPGSPPTKTSFPLRNATMSAYGGCTMVVAAGERSGARIQARQAIAHGRPLILSADVASTTSWGQELASSAYDVAVVGSVDDALAVIGELLDRPARVSQILHDLTG